MLRSMNAREFLVGPLRVPRRVMDQLEAAGLYYPDRASTLDEASFRSRAGRILSEGRFPEQETDYAVDILWAWSNFWKNKSTGTT